MQNRVRQLEDEHTKFSSREKNRTKEQARIELLEKILEEAKCICTRELTPDLLIHLESELEKAKNSAITKREDISTSYSKNAEVRSELQGILASLKQEHRDPNDIRLLKLRKDQSLEEVEQDIAKLRDQLKEDADQDVQAVYQALEANQKDQDEAKVELGRLERELKEVDESLNKFEKEMNKHLSFVEGFEGLQKELAYLENLRAAIEDLVDLFIQERRSTIQSNLNRVFKSITNKPKEYEEVALNEDFSLRVITKSGNKIEPEKLSAGEKEVLAFSFIAGLNLASDNPAPLVMDTPFGHLDIHHRNGLLEALPTLPNQVILLATDRDLPVDERKRFDRNIASEFELYRLQNEERTIIRPLGD